MIGILALQGAFAEHEAMLRGLGADCVQIRNVGDLRRGVDGLVLPGGESTVMGKLLDDLGLLEPLKDRIQEGMPVLGTCAGMILLARQVDQAPGRCFATMDIHVARNAYGRQLGSFRAWEPCLGQPMEMPFIRAPYVREAGTDVEIMARVQGRIVAVRQGCQIATAFHPELTQDTRVHRLFLELIQGRPISLSA